jgi:hypothetical protein
MQMSLIFNVDMLIPIRIVWLVCRSISRPKSFVRGLVCGPLCIPSHLSTLVSAHQLQMAQLGDAC